MDKKTKRLLSVVLSFLMFLPSAPVPAYAMTDEGEEVAAETNGENTTTEATTDKQSDGETVEKEERQIEENKSIRLESAKAENSENDVTEEPEKVTSNIYVAQDAAAFAGAVSQIPDESENRVMLETEKNIAEILTNVEYSAVAYDGVYVVDFGSENDKNIALETLENDIGTENIAADVEFSLDDDEDHSDLIQEGSKSEDTTSEETPEETPQKQESETIMGYVPEEVKLPESQLKARAILEDKIIVAVIDTGANDDTADELVNLTDAASAYDDNGHGTKIASVIKEMSDDRALILSIKAFDASGKSSSSTMYAAVRYAMEAGADIINISASASDSPDAQMFKEAIGYAVEAGIKVVASVGNGHVDAENMIPANIDGVEGITSLDAETHEIKGNYGRFADYGVVADSTSVAAATYSGLLARGNYDSFKNDILFEINEDGTVKEDPFEPGSEEWGIDCTATFYGKVRYWVIPQGQNTVDGATTMPGSTEKNYSTYVNTHGTNGTPHEWTGSNDDWRGYPADGRTFNSGVQSWNIAKENFDGYNYRGYVFQQHNDTDGSVPAAKTSGGFTSTGTSLKVEMGEWDATYWDNVPGVNEIYWKGWDNTSGGDKIRGGFAVDFYYESAIPRYNVNVTYVDYDNHSNILTPKFVAVKGKIEGETYSYNTAETVTKDSVVYYRKSVDKGDNPAVLSGTMPGADVDYTVYYRRKYNLTINYVELDNPSNVLQSPTKASYTVDENYSHNIPKSLTKGGNVYYVNSRSDKVTDLTKVTGKMPNKDIEITIYYKLGHMIETKVTNGKITRSGGKLGPDSYVGDWEVAYDGINDGDNRTISYEPKPGFVLDYIKVDGKKLSDEEEIKNKKSFTFSNINADHNIEVVYVKTPLPNDSKKVFNEKDKEINRRLVVAGQTLTYKVTIENTFSEDKVFTVTDVIPTETEYVNGSASDNGTYDAGKRMVSWKMTIPKETNKTISFKVKVLDEAKGKTEYNTADVYYDDVNLQTNTVENPVLPDPEKAVKDDAGVNINGKMVDPEDTLHYEIVVKNPGTLPEVFTITDKMVNMTAVESSINYEGKLTGNTIVWNVKIPAKGSVVLKFDAHANGYDLEIPNTGIVTLNDYDIETNPTVVWTPPKPVKSVKTINGIDIDGKAIKLNDEFYYEIVARNNSDLKKTYTITDTIPEEVKFLEAGHKTDKYVAKGSGASNEGNNVKWTFELKPGETKTLYIKGRLEKVDTAFDNHAHQTVEMSDVDSNTVTNWSGRIIINAEVTEYYPPYGQPAFMYDITDQNGKGTTWDRMIIIDPETRKGQAYFDIPTGHGQDTWIVEDVKGTRYTFVSATPETTNMTTSGNTGIALINPSSRVGIVDYLYEISRWDETSHKAAVTNTVNYKRS